MVGPKSSGDSNRKSQAEIKEFARQTLKDHGLFSVPVNPIVVANKLGIRVYNAVFSDTKFSGLAAKRSNGFSILVKQGDHPYRKRFTVAHEIGHALLHLESGPDEIIDTDSDFFRVPPGDPDSWSIKRRREYEANLFAAELLMPVELMKTTWENLSKDDRSVSKMALAFQVSEEAMGYRLNDLGLFEDE